MVKILTYSDYYQIKSLKLNYNGSVFHETCFVCWFGFAKDGMFIHHGRKMSLSKTYYVWLDKDLN